ncbi:hypothetical protein [Candidatus Bandiella euplotis]|uniref:Uncharacterized protein n=1 Tax=Candidatus Bandiella euplotis TaxID=1664265 RepID=A0ABZ0UMJ6_9RICK|nr:hypothetical protein [Candidatus Bandiella woodruffii]WPX96288.1 hypothetical protein Bandiella_00397 [Candidatus Bandiella woodruffii]
MMSISKLKTLSKVLLKGFISFGKLSSVDAIIKNVAGYSSHSNHFDVVVHSILDNFNIIKNEKNEAKERTLHKKGL